MTESGQPSDFHDRQAPRVSLDEVTNLRQNLYCVEVKLKNLSTTGFMAECADNVSIGSFVSLDVPGCGPVHAQVRWQLVGRMGGMFLDPISLSRCEWIATRVEEEQAAA